MQVGSARKRLSRHRLLFKFFYCNVVFAFESFQYAIFNDLH